MDYYVYCEDSDPTYESFKSLEEASNSYCEKVKLGLKCELICYTRVVVASFFPDKCCDHGA